ncbi:Thioesterase-like protein [Nostocoides japonicum T1-X7]|uniref:Thioesterase-like protein n=1 Tax=Nostocoides japonicum T1-X7 TaxID=1194083 RepID=A0A077LZH1_9MICO|nr:thioesterase family protein [Tetrasphaera japonica]CCH79021.1 Thioesterase-like protein [Tetrasphaera japonica T1-X7]
MSGDRGDDTASRPAPAVVWREPVREEWIDYNGHLSEPYYVLVLGHATDAVMDAIGLGEAERAAHGTSLYTLEAHVRYLAEVPSGVELEARSWVVGAGPKLVWLWHELWGDGRLRATEEILAVHVDATAGRSSPFPAEVAERIAALRSDPPPEAGRRIELR